MLIALWMQNWAQSLPSHVQLNAENLETHVTMFETSSNSGAWCFCFMHAMYPCYLAMLKVRFSSLTDPRIYT